MIQIIVRSIVFATLAFSAVSPLLSQEKQALSSDTDATRANLSKTVHLNLGVTTMDALTAAISTQTGLTVKAAEYLYERKLIVRMDNLSASAALDSLDELNDWTWFRTNTNQILITRRRLRMDVAAASIPRLVQAAIPHDMRTYLNIRTPSEDISNYVNPLSVIRNASLHAEHEKIYKALAMDKSALLNSLAPQIFNGEPIAFSKLNSAQRSQLLESLIYPMLSQTEERLLHTDALPHVADVNNAVISLKDGTLLEVGSEYITPEIKSAAGLGFQVR